MGLEILMDELLGLVIFAGIEHPTIKEAEISPKNKTDNFFIFFTNVIIYCDLMNDQIVKVSLIIKSRTHICLLADDDNLQCSL